MKKKKLRLKRSVISGLKLILGLCLLIISIYFLIIGSNHNIEKENVIATTNEINNIDYQVYLKENSYFTVPYLPKGERYIASLIDRVHVVYSHQFEMTKDFMANYKYRVVGTLSALEKKENGAYHKIWNKQYILKPEQEIKIVDSNSVEIKDSFDIDYQYYKTLAKNFKNEYAVAMDATLNIKIYLDMDGTLAKDKKDIQNTVVLEMNIPLEDETIDIATIYNKAANKNVITENETKLVKDTPTFFIGCFTFAASVVVVASYLIELISNSKKQFSYEKEKKKLLSKYDSDIVNASKIPDMSGLDVIEITSFHELLDAKETMKTPIIFIEVIPGIAGWFMIMNHDQVWRYRLEGKLKKQ